MVAMTVLLCTPKILKFEHCAWTICQLKFLGHMEWKCERTMSTLNTAVVLPLVVYLYLNGAV